MRRLLLRLRPGGRGLPTLGPLGLLRLPLGLPATRDAASGEHREAKSAAQPPAEPERDWVGPPDRDSNLRPVRVGRRSPESPLEFQLRELRGDTEAWSHHFWSEQNLAFSRPPAEPERDWVGPPDQDSNLRPVRVGRRSPESPLEFQLRELRGDTEAWSHHFWSEQNLAFSREKQEFIVKRLRDKGLGIRDEDGSKRSLSVEEMAEFYKGFLDDNYTKHLNYNKEWYRRNFTMTWMMARVAMLRAWRFVLSGGRPR